MAPVVSNSRSTGLSAAAQRALGLNDLFTRPNHLVDHLVRRTELRHRDAEFVGLPSPRAQLARVAGLVDRVLDGLEFLIAEGGHFEAGRSQVDLKGSRRNYGPRNDPYFS